MMQSADIKPWEPVSGWWVDPGGAMENRHASWSWRWTGRDCAEVNPDMALRVTLANGQTVIVRALSEEKKGKQAWRKLGERSLKKMEAKMRAECLFSDDVSADEAYIAMMMMEPIQ